MSAEARTINNQPVPKENLRWLLRLGIGFRVPAGCLDCEILTTKRSAEARGLTVIRRPSLSGIPSEQYFPQSKENEVQEEIETRVKDAVSGVCRFILQQECWRVETIEE